MPTTTDHVSTNIDEHMTQEWDTAYAGTPLPHEWQLIDAGMATLETLGDLLRQMRPRGRYSDSDTVFLALITRAQAGESLAGRVLLQQLQPRCRQLLATAAKRDLEDPASAVYAAA